MPAIGPATELSVGSQSVHWRKTAMSPKQDECCQKNWLLVLDLKKRYPLVSSFSSVWFPLLRTNLLFDRWPDENFHSSGTLESDNSAKALFSSSLWAILFLNIWLISLILKSISILTNSYGLLLSLGVVLEDIWILILPLILLAMLPRIKSIILICMHFFHIRTNNGQYQPSTVRNEPIHA